MPQKNDPGFRDPAVPDDLCPKCGAEMESISVGAEGPPVEQLQLCPRCYLVTWCDKDGLHVQQGLPVKRPREQMDGFSVDPTLPADGAKDS
jgi:Zn-finger nucleic acid-binding protein